MRLIAVAVQLGNNSLIIKAAKACLGSSNLVGRRLETFCSASYHSMPIVEPVQKRVRMSESELTIGTHDGIFHCDEILACFMLKQLPEYENAKIIRTRDQKKLDECDMVVDVGSVFDHGRKRYDHHQRSFTETFSSLRPELGSSWKIKLSSAGLVYTYYGEDVIRSVLKKHKNIDISEKFLKVLYIKIYDTLIQEIDGIDNGVPIYDGEPNYRITTNLSSRAGRFNPSWNEENPGKPDELFVKAMKYVGEEFLDKIFYYSVSWWPAREIVGNAIKKRFEVYKSGEILELSSPCPWKEHLAELEKEHSIEGIPKYVVFNNGGTEDWRVMCVPEDPTSFICRKFLHKDWRGIRDEDLIKASGIDVAKFCHVTGFIGGSKTKEGALKMAEISLLYQEAENTSV